MRVALACCVVLGCSEPTYVPRPLPTLVAPKASTELVALTVPALGFTAGDRFVYMVRVRGFTIGSAEIVVGGAEIRSKFATSMLAKAIASVEHELVTTLVEGRAGIAHERLELDGTSRQFTTNYAGSESHSLHTALGVVRTWAKLGAAAGFMHVVVGEHVVRVELAEPTGGKDWLRVEGKLVGLESPAAFTCWLDRTNTITRIDIRSDGEQITAELVR